MTRIEAQITAASPDRSILLTASAGSGKTRALVNRIVHLLATGAAPDRISAMTFTDKSAAEMKDRLYKALSKAAWAEETVEAMLGLEPRDVVRPIVKSPQGILSELLSGPDALRISTIHAFCLGLLRRFPIEAGLTPEFGIMDQSDIPLRRTVAVDACLRDVNKGTLSDEFRVLADAGKSVAEVRDLLLLGLDKRSVLTRLADNNGGEERLAGLLMEAADGAWTAFDGLLGDVDRLAGELYDYLEMTGLGGIESCAGLDGLMGIDGRDGFPKAFAGSRKLFYRADGEFLKRPPLTKISIKPLVKQNEGLKGKALDERVTDVLAEFEEKYLPLRDAVNNMAALVDMAVERAAAGAFIRLYAAAERQYTRANLMEGLLDYDDLEIYTYRLLSGAKGQDILSRMEERTIHLLVDEFQDTSGIQYEILKMAGSEVYAGQGAEELRSPTFFGVGDTKQSIYRFRKADYTLMNRHRGLMDETIEPSARAFPELSANFRSAPEIITVVNDIFSRLFEEDGYIPSEPKKPFARGSVKLMVVGKAEEAITLAAEAKAASGLMIWDNGAELPRPAGYGDMAVLIRSRTGLQAYEAAFTTAGVPFRVVNGIGFFYQPEVHTIISVLKFLDNSSDGISLASALKSPLFNCSDREIEGVLSADDREKALEAALPEASSLLAGWRRHARLYTPGRLVEAIVTESEAVYRFGGTGGPPAVMNIEKLVAVARAFDIRGGGGLSEFIEWVKSYRDNTEMATADVDLPGEKDYLSIMTVHAAKGLEFPVVFLPGATKKPNNRPDGLIISDDDISIQTGSLLKNSVGWSEAYEHEKEEGAREWQRLFYVALTRAKDHLIIVGEEAIKKDGSSGAPVGSWLSMLGQAAPANLFGDINASGPLAAGTVLIYPEPPEHLTGEASSEKHVAQQALPDVERLAPLPVPRRLIFTSPSSLADAHFEHTGPVGADGLLMLRGSLIHKMLEIYGINGSFDAESAARAVDGPELMPMHERKAFINEAAAAVNRFLADDEMRRLVAPAANKYREVQLLQLRGDQLISGTADLVVFADGRATVYDYKTGLTGLTNEEVARVYALQLSAYREAAREAFGVDEAEAFIVLVDKVELIGM